MNVQLPAVWNAGWIEVICGSMFSGKTEELIRRLKRAQIARQKVQIFKPKLDNRYSEDHITSHSLLSIQATAVENSSEILHGVDDNTRVVGVDEAQFLDAGVLDVCHRMANRGIRVLVAGLDMDFRGEPFGPMPQLMATAEFVTKMNAICSQCGNPASRTQRVRQPASGKTDSQILVGSTEFYEARCRRCFEIGT